jgi:hypothetical protein
VESTITNILCLAVILIINLIIIIIIIITIINPFIASFEDLFQEDLTEVSFSFNDV